jgi:hypothetical protein
MYVHSDCFFPVLQIIIVIIIRYCASDDIVLFWILGVFQYNRETVLVSPCLPPTYYCSLKVVCGKGHCHDAKSTCPAKELLFYDESAAVYVPEVEGRILA